MLTGGLWWGQHRGGWDGKCWVFECKLNHWGSVITQFQPEPHPSAHMTRQNLRRLMEMAAFAGKRLQLSDRSTHTNKTETATSSLDGDDCAVSSFWISCPLSQLKHAPEHPRFCQTCLSCSRYVMIGQPKICQLQHKSTQDWISQTLELSNVPSFFFILRHWQLFFF